MEGIENFESFYSTKIQPHMKLLDEDESALQNWKKFTIFTGIGCVLFFFLYVIKIFPSGVVLAVGMLIMCLIGVFFWTRYSDRYLDDFKEKVIGEIISFIHPSVVYKPMGFVSKREYKASGLFRRRFSHFDGDDYWQSVYNGVAFHCSEITSWYEDSGGVENIFKGLFFVANISNSFCGGTYIWIKGKAQLLKSIADERYRMYPLPNIVKINAGNIAFDKLYSIYTTNTSEASVILSQNMLNQMLLIKEKLEKDIVFSFVAGKCYIAVPFEENLLEPTKKGVRDKQEIKNYFYTILLVFNIIRKLELNRLT